MKRLFFAPFLLASLFSFGGELKAHPNSPYEKQNTKLNISDRIRLNNNNPRQYSLRMGLVRVPKNPENIGIFVGGSRFEISETLFRDFPSCLSAKRSLKNFIKSIELSAEQRKTSKKIVYGSCSPAEKTNESKYKIPEYYKYQLDWVTKNQVVMNHYLPSFPARFSNKSSCENNGMRHVTQIKNWSIPTDFRNTNFDSKYICIKTKKF